MGRCCLKFHLFISTFAFFFLPYVGRHVNFQWIQQYILYVINEFNDYAVGQFFWWPELLFHGIRWRFFKQKLLEIVGTISYEVLDIEPGNLLLSVLLKTVAFQLRSIRSSITLKLFTNYGHTDASLIMSLLDWRPFFVGLSLNYNFCKSLHHQHRCLFLIGLFCAQLQLSIKPLSDPPELSCNVSHLLSFNLSLSSIWTK